MYKFIYYESINIVEIYKDDRYLISRNLKGELNNIDDITVIDWCELFISNQYLYDKEERKEINYIILKYLKRGEYKV